MPKKIKGFLIWFFIALFASLCFGQLSVTAYDSFDMTKWDVPVLFGGVPQLHGNRFYIFDQYEGHLKAYDISAGFDKPDFLWHSPGKGQGPGETPKGIFLKNIAVNDQTGRVWLSHSEGFNVFEADGTFVKFRKRPYSESWLLPVKDSLYSTSPNPIRVRYAILKLPTAGGRPIWKLPNPEELPVLADGGVVNPLPELYLIDEKIVYYESTTGELLVATLDGKKDLIAYNKNLYRDKFEPVATIPMQKYGMRYRLYTHPYARSGVVKIDGNYLCLSISYGKGVTGVKAQYTSKEFGIPRARMRLLSKINAQGQLVGQYFHKLCLEQITILGKSNGKLVFFEQEAGEKVYTASLDSFERIKHIIP